MKSVMTHNFRDVPTADIPRSSFNLSHGLKTTFDADYLIPIGVHDVGPGDTFNMNISMFARLATPLHPIMDNLYIDLFAFYIPYRLCWENWEKFMGAQDDPNDSISYTIPVCTGGPTQTGEGSLWDYFGLPLDTKLGAHIDPDNVTVSSLPFRAYTLVYDHWFRDQNLQDSWHAKNSTFFGDGPDTLQTSVGSTDVYSNPLKRGKRHDYFTSCLPAPQKGGAVPIFSEAIVHSPPSGDAQLAIYSDADSDTRYMEIGATFLREENGTSSGAGATTSDKLMYAKATDTINDLRLAFQTQKLLERDARSGTRYNETILAHWGVTVPDFRVQRPEVLMTSSHAVNITPVANTSEDATSKQGDLTGFGTVNGQAGFTHSFVEHGIVMLLANARADITYSQGIDRYWGKQTRYDFMYPVLSQIGEQAVLNREIYTQADGATNDDNVFGYQERYAEYRYCNSKLTGLMNVDAASSLSAWHLSEEFTTLPTLGDSFIQSNTGTPLDRAIAVPSEPHFIADFYFDLKAARPMPLYGVPGNLDHF